MQRALRGFRELRPPRSRAPLSKDIVGAIVAILASWNQHDIAMMVALMFLTLLLPEHDAHAPMQRISNTEAMDDTVLSDR